MTEAIQYAVLGIGICAVYTLLVQGLLVVHGGSGVLNFAHGAMAMVAAYLYWQLRTVDHWSVATSWATCLAALATIGCGVYLLVMRPLRHASTMSAVVATLGLLIVMQGATALRWGAQGRALPSDLPRRVDVVRGVFVPEDRLWLIGIAVALTAALSAVYRLTPLGLAIRAGSENQRGVAALGWSPDVMGAVTWTLGAVLAGAAGILAAPLIGLSLDQMPLLVIPVLAAGLIGGFTSFWGALAGAFFIGLSQSVAFGYLNQVQGITWTLPFAVIVVLLVVRGKGLPARGYVVERLPAVGSGAVRWWLVLPLVGVAAALMLTVFDAILLDAIAISLAWAVLMLSVVVLLGFTNQLSFEQMAMAGIATLFARRFIGDLGVPFGLSFLLAVALAVPIGAVFAIPALRTRGVNLAVVTLGLGAVVTDTVLPNAFLRGGRGSPSPPSLFGISLEYVHHTDRYAVFALVVFVLCAAAVANVRRGGAGRALIAVRANERAAAALGISVLQAKLYAFVLGCALASVGGILYTYHSFTVSSSPYNSILVVSYAVIGGVGFASGPLVGMLITTGGLGGWLVSRLWPGSTGGSYWLLVGTGALVVLIVVCFPDGLVSLVPRARRRRVVAQPTADPAMPAPRRATLEVRDLVVRFGAVTAVDGVSFTVRPGEVLGLIGPNGAGKTTIIDAVTGFVRPAAGSIHLDGAPIDRWPAHRRSRDGIGRSFQSLELFEHATVEDNLRVACDARALVDYCRDLVAPPSRPLPPAAVAAARALQIDDATGVRVTDLPYGQRRRTAIARTLATAPSVLLLDEPAAGLDAAELGELAGVVRRLAAERGLAILVVEHELTFVMEACDRIVVLDFGRTLAEGSPAEIAADPAVVAAYLGEPSAEDDAIPLRALP
jgi:sulfate-transporting ATPase